LDVSVTIQVRRGPAAHLPTLASGEPAWTTDTHHFYVGDGTTNHQIDVGGGGTVTSVALSMPSQFSVAGSPITTSGTFTVSWGNENANLVFAGPSSGGAAAPTFRALVTADLPAGTGTVTSVALSMPSIFSVSGSPVTTSGTLTATLANENANTVFAGPVSGAAAAPTFRTLTVPDESGPVRQLIALANI
jgi:hypothetical protein